MSCVLILVATTCTTGARTAGKSTAQETLRLTLPRTMFAVPGVEMGFYFDNIVLTKTPENYRFEVKCSIGQTRKRSWRVTPTDSDVGEHNLQITVTGANKKRLASATTTLRVVPSNAGAGKNVSLLIVGDSLTHATFYPNEVARLLSRPGNPQWKMLGTHKPKSAADNVAHEGYGGWTWQRFASHYEPKPDGTYRKRSSPFVYLGDNGKTVLDIDRYFREECGGKLPNFVVFMLGINDCFSVPPDDPKAIDARIDAVFKQADVLLSAFRKAAPQAEIGICLTTPPNSREAAFQANYKDRYRRWGWKRIQHRLVQRQIKRFSKQEAARVFVIPTQLNLDPIDGYPENNGVHPNKAGYEQIGASIYAWLKSRLAKPRQLSDRAKTSRSEKLVLVNTRRIWNAAPHNAFTDLLRFKNRWYCVFREGKAHVSPDGALRVITSQDGEKWESLALIKSAKYDLRDAKLTATPDGRLMLNGAGMIANAKVRYFSMSWFSEDGGRTWDDGRQIGDDGFWLWRTQWHKGVAYSMGYSTERDRTARTLRLYKSADGRRFETMIKQVSAPAGCGEDKILFLEDKSALCLLRHETGDKMAQVGTADPPYTKWKWRSSNLRIGGPNMIQLPDGRILAVTRLYRGGTRTSLSWLDPETAKLTEVLKLPSGGDTSYAGLVWHGGLLWISYYSSHEGKPSIYLAKVKTQSQD
jgi:lysophospholipase L1-like esterase